MTSLWATGWVGGPPSSIRHGVEAYRLTTRSHGVLLYSCRCCSGDPDPIFGSRCSRMNWPLRHPLFISIQPLFEVVFSSCPLKTCPTNQQVRRGSCCSPLVQWSCAGRPQQRELSCYLLEEDLGRLGWGTMRSTDINGFSSSQWRRRFGGAGVASRLPANDHGYMDGRATMSDDHESSEDQTGGAILPSTSISASVTEHGISQHGRDPKIFYAEHATWNGTDVNKGGDQEAK